MLLERLLASGEGNTRSCPVGWKNFHMTWAIFASPRMASGRPKAYGAARSCRTLQESQVLEQIRHITSNGRCCRPGKKFGDCWFSNFTGKTQDACGWLPNGTGPVLTTGNIDG